MIIISPLETKKASFHILMCSKHTASMSLAFLVSLGNLIYHTLIDVIVVISNVYWKIHVVVKLLSIPSLALIKA